MSLSCRCLDEKLTGSSCVAFLFHNKCWIYFLSSKFSFSSSCVTGRTKKLSKLLRKTSKTEGKDITMLNIYFLIRVSFSQTI